MGVSGSSLNCTGKRSKKYNKQRRLSETLDRRRPSLDALRNKLTEVIPKVNQYDRGLVEDQVRTVEKAFAELETRTERKQKGYQLLSHNLHDIKAEINQYVDWLDEKNKQIEKDETVGYNVKDAELKFKEQEVLKRELEDKQYTVDNVIQKGGDLLQDLHHNEREEVEAWISAVQAKQTHVLNKASDKQKRLADDVTLREEFHTGLEKASQWLESKERAAGKLNSVKLYAAEAEKQADKCKNILMEAVSYQPNLEQVFAKSRSLIAQCEPETTAELQHRLSDVQNRYDDLCASLREQQNHLRNLVTSRRVFEGDLQKIDRWCKDSEIKCTGDLGLDCSMEVLDVQHKLYVSLNNAAHVFESLKKETEERGESFLPSLFEADRPVLQQQLNDTHIKFEKMCGIVRERLKSVEDAINARAEVSDTITDATQWLSAVQEEIRKSSKPIGPKVTDAESSLRKFEEIQEKLANYQPTMIQLSQPVEMLRASGQSSNADEIVRIMAQYEMLQDQVTQHCARSRQAVNNRHQLKEQLTELETLAKESEIELQSAAVSNASMPVKLEKLKAVAAKKNFIKPQIAAALDKAKQIGIDGTAGDAEVVISTIHALDSKFDVLKSMADSKSVEVNSLKKNREQFETMLDQSLAWLEQKGEVLATCNPLDLDPDKIDVAFMKHRALSEDAFERLERIKEKCNSEISKFGEMNEPIPSELSDKIHQVNMLDSYIKESVCKKDEYLMECKADREQLDTSLKQITGWLRGAEEMLDSGYEGLDYDSINNTLSEHTDYFSEASFCQDEMEQVMELSEKLLPTLDTNDKETLRQSLLGLNHKLSTVLTASQRKHELLDSKYREWQEYQDSVLHMNQTIEELETHWNDVDVGSVVQPEEVKEKLTQTKVFIGHIEKQKPKLGDLSEKCKDLDKAASHVSRTMLNQSFSDVNQKWNALVNKIETKKQTLQELTSNWGEHATLMDTVQLVMNKAEEDLPLENIENLSNANLLRKLDSTKMTLEQLENLDSKIVTLKRITQNMQRTLPTAESKIQTQEQIISLTEKFERLQEQARENHSTVQEEIDDREAFHTEVRQTMDWLKDVKQELHTIEPKTEAHDVMEKIEKQKMIEQEVAIRVEQARRMTHLQEAKYSSQGKDIPEEMKEHVISMKELEAEVSKCLQEKEEELLNIKEDRNTFDKLNNQVTDWLNYAEKQLSTKVVDVPESRQQHEVLLGEFDEFKQFLDQLRAKGGDLIRHSPNPTEKQNIQRSLADTNRKWLALQAHAADKTQKLNEAEELTKSFDETAQNVETWIEQAQALLSTEPSWANFDTVREQLKQHKLFSREIDHYQGKLKLMSSTVKQMDNVSDATTSLNRLADLNSCVMSIQDMTAEKVRNLEATTHDIDDHEREVADLNCWMEQTRAHLTMKDATVNLKDQLEEQEKILNDIEDHKRKVETVLHKHTELTSDSVDAVPSTGAKLTSEIHQLNQIARENCSQLKQDIAQQEQYETDIQKLTAAMNDAQNKLLASPVQASSVEALKKQIADHNTLASEIKSYQTKIGEINQKSQEITDRNASPLIGRRLYGSHGSVDSKVTLDSGVSTGSLTSVQPKSQFFYSNSSDVIEKISSPVSLASKPPRAPFKRERSADSFGSKEKSHVFGPARSQKVDNFSKLLDLPNDFDIPDSKSDVNDLTFDGFNSNPRLIQSKTDTGASFTNLMDLSNNSFRSDPIKPSTSSVFTNQCGSELTKNDLKASNTHSHGKPISSGVTRWKQSSPVSFLSDQSPERNFSAGDMKSNKDNVVGLYDTNTKDKVFLSQKTDKTSAFSEIKPARSKNLEPKSKFMKMNSQRLNLSQPKHNNLQTRPARSKQLNNFEPKSDLVKLKPARSQDNRTFSDFTKVDSLKNTESENSRLKNGLKNVKTADSIKTDSQFGPHNLFSDRSSKTPSGFDSTKICDTVEIQPAINLTYLTDRGNVEPQKHKSSLWTATKPVESENNKTFSDLTKWETFRNYTHSPKTRNIREDSPRNSTDPIPKLDSPVDNKTGTSSYVPPNMLSLKPGVKPRKNIFDIRNGLKGEKVSSSVPNIFEQLNQGRERSSSFGSKARSPRPLGHHDPRMAELHQSWNSLQNQLGAKERELQSALQRQERYQQSVQDVTTRMERVQAKLGGRYTPGSHSLQQDLQGHKEILQEIDGIKEDIAKVKERGRQLMERTDPEAYRAMQATVAMLSDRAENLHALAGDKGKHLENKVKDKQKQDIELQAYKKRVRELDSWLTEMKIRHSSGALPTDSPDILKQQIADNEDLLQELNNKLRQMSDLAVQCDSLCESESPQTAAKLHTDLTTLQKNLGDFKLVGVEKQGLLKNMLKESEKRKKDMDDYEENVHKLQEWMKNTEKVTLLPLTAEFNKDISSEQQELQENLEKDLSQHHQLIKHLSGSNIKPLQARQLEAGARMSPSLREDDLQLKWESLCKDITQKKDNLFSMLKNQPKEDLPARAWQHRSGPYGVEADTAAQLSNIRNIMGELTDYWHQLQVQVENRQVRLDQALGFQDQFQNALQAISEWMDAAEKKLLKPDVDKDTNERAKDYETLMMEIKSLKNEVNQMNSAAHTLLDNSSPESQDWIKNSLSNLNERLTVMEYQTQEQGIQLGKVSTEYKKYQEEMANLHKKLLDIKNLLAATKKTDGPIHEPISNIQRVKKKRRSFVKKIEAQMKSCGTQIENLKKKEKELSAIDPHAVRPTELNALQNNYIDLQRKVMDRKADLLQTVSVQEQYDKMLQDYADFLDTAENKLQHETIAATDLDNLKQQMNAHKDFFSDLEVHRAMLDSLAAQCDPTTRQNLLPKHTQLSNQTYVIQDKASLHGQRLDRLVRQWSELEGKSAQLQRFLSAIEQQIPQPVSSADSMRTIQEKIDTYQRLQKELNSEKPLVFHVVDKGKQLLHTITCPTLEGQVSDLADKWVDLNTNLSHELKRTETLGSQLQEFEAQAAVLQSWLSTANMKLSSLKQLSERDSESISTIRSKVDKLLEFRKEVENQEELKDKVMTVGTQLLQNKTYNTAGLKERLERIENQWGLLLHDIDKAEEYLHQAQMEQMPSRQALSELVIWLDSIQKTVAEDKNKPVRSLADIEVMLKKYKGYKTDLKSKQLTVDFVSQSAQRAEQPDQTAAVEISEFSDKLKNLTERWNMVLTDVNGRLKELEHLHSKWDNYERLLSRLQQWFNEQEDKVKFYSLMGHEVMMKQTMKDCKALQQLLQAKESDLKSVKDMGKELIAMSQGAPSCQQSVRNSVDEITRRWSSLESRLSQVHDLLDDILSQWDKYHSTLHSLNAIITDMEYTLTRYNLMGGDLPTVRVQVEKLKSLIINVEENSHLMDEFVKLGNKLTQVCEKPVQEEINKTLSNLQERWHTLLAELKKRASRFGQCLDCWQKYEEEYLRSRNWLDSKENIAQEIIAMRDDSEKRSHCVQLCRKLQSDVDNFQSQLSALYKLSDEVTKNLDQSAIVNLTTRQASIEQRALALRQSLAQLFQTVEGDVSLHSQFHDLFRLMENFLKYSERILEEEDPNTTSEERAMYQRLDQLKDLSNQFNINLQNLDNLNDHGYRLALSEESSAALRELNHKWHRLYGQMTERCKTLQGLLLVQQDFTQKCETWMVFLAQTEQDLMKEIAGNLVDLLDQQRRCEKFEAEIYSRQQVLHAIINDGKLMLKEGDIENKEDFQEKLHLLEDQWQSVLRRATQRKAIIDKVIQQWQTSNDLSERLREWLKEKEMAMCYFDFDTASLQKVKSLLEKVKYSANEFKNQEENFNKIHEIGTKLLQRADPPAAEEIRVSMAQLQQHWYQIFGKLDDHRERLETILQHWQDCDGDIEELLSWLKDTRRTLANTVPSNYDELQGELHQCKDIETSFANYDEKRQTLLAKVKRLASVIQPEDLSILHQRIRLLNKQWDELFSQAQFRGQQIGENMTQWSSFNDQVREMCEWYEQMEVRVVSTKEYHIEDLLQKINGEFKREIEEKDKVKKELTNLGHRLMKASSEIRASDIEQRLTKMEEKAKHMKAVVDFRERKLQETLLAVQQLDTSIANLRTWLSEMEQQLTGPLNFQECDMREIHRKLNQQQDLQHDIEKHSAGVGSVINLCEVLLHDSDACPTEVEYIALQTAMKNLDRRWRNICQMSPDLRTKIEKTWDSWQAYLKDCNDFGHILSEMEKDVTNYELPDESTEITDEELRRYEKLQKYSDEHLPKLEHINKQYRMFVTDGCTDSKGELKERMRDCNNRWDRIQQPVNAMKRRLKHSSTIRDEYNDTRSNVISWLADVDSLLNRMEGQSDMDIPSKIMEMEKIQRELDQNRRKIELLDQAAQYLIKRGDAMEASRIQREQDEFKTFSDDVISRIKAYQDKLVRISSAQVEDIEQLEKRADKLGVDGYELYRSAGPLGKYSNNFENQLQELERYLEESPPESPPGKRRATDRLRGRLSRSPKSFDEDLGLYSTREERRRHMKDEISERGKLSKVEALLEDLVDALEECAEKLLKGEQEFQHRILLGPGSGSLEPYLADCEISFDNVKSLERLIKLETGLSTISSIDSQIDNVTRRWEILQAQSTELNYDQDREAHDFSMFVSDLENLLSWLDEAEMIQSRHTSLPSDITELDIIIRQHKDFLVQLESKKARVLSVNLLSKNYIDPRTIEGRELKYKLREMNRRWDAVTAKATVSQKNLQVSLMQCQEFHHEVHDLLLWLENLETKLRQNEPVDLNCDEGALWSKYRQLLSIRSDLESNQARVMSLKDTADQLLLNTDASDMIQAKDKMHIIANRLRSMLRLSTSYISSLEERLDMSKQPLSVSSKFDSYSSDLTSPRLSHSHSPRQQIRPPSVLHGRTRSPYATTRQQILVGPSINKSKQSMDDDTSSVQLEESKIRPYPPYWSRVCKAALPIQALMLLLLGLVYLLPMCEEDFNCFRINNFKKSLSPMLHYTDGPPPT